MSETERPTLTTAWIVEGPDGARVQKAASTRQQLAEDPFRYTKVAGESGLVQPLYSLEDLSAMLELNSLHSRACKQKASDIAGRGFTLKGTEGKDPDQAAQDRFGEFVANVESDERGDESFKERITFAAQDYESVGWGVLEFSRAADGSLDGMWHIPAHTMRAHADGRRFAQKRGGKTVWFKRFGLAGTVARDTGEWDDRSVLGDWTGNEVVVVRNYTPRSSYYGLPDHVPALSAIAGWRAQAEFNVRFFDNQAVPSYAVIIEGADISPELEATVLDHFRQIKGDPHRTIIIAVPGLPGDEAMQPKLRFERLSVDVKDASFRLYKQDNALEICIAHGIPPYRVGWPILGSLGGATAEEMTQIYNDGIVEPRQETWEGRLTRAILGVKGLALADTVLKAAALDTRNEALDIEKTQALWDMGVITKAAIAAFYNLEPLSPEEGAKLKTASAPGGFGGFGAPADPLTAALLAKRWSGEVAELVRIRKRLEEIIEPGAAAA
jgi:PBSX family phage portal protein